MPRESIAMTPPEVRQLLSEERWMVLGTLDPDGSPWADAVCVHLEGPHLYFGVDGSGRSGANLRRDPRACCAIDRFPSYYEIRGVTVHGRAEPVTDASERRQRLSQLAAPGSPADAAPGEAAIFRLPLDDVFSFDFARIQRKF